MSGIATPQPVAAVGSGVVPQSITAAPSHHTLAGGSLHHAKSAAEACEDDSDVGTHTSFVADFHPDGGFKWDRTKTAYKATILQRAMDRFQSADGSRAVIDQLKEFGITVYLAEHDGLDLPLLRQVVRHVASSKTDRSRSKYDNQRCLLYRDENGRLFNLTLDNGANGLASTWRGNLASYSGLQATVAMTVLARAFACADVAGASLAPLILALVLGVVLREETSHVWLNVDMLVRGAPSVAAHSLLARSDLDWPRKLVVLLLAVASAVGEEEEGTASRRICALSGVGMAVALLVANLGARAWYHMRWRPLKRGTGRLSVLSPALALLLAALTGLVFPYVGFRRIQAGGRSAVRLVIANCVIVALAFVASDMDAIQRFLLAGSHVCDQDGVNVALGIWIAMSSVSCLFAARRIAPGETHPEDGDPILVEEQASPVGFRVPNFPDFRIDPEAFERKVAASCCSGGAEVALGLVVGVGMGAFVVSTSLYDYMDRANEYIAQGGGSAQAAASELI